MSSVDDRLADADSLRSPAEQPLTNHRHGQPRDLGAQSHVSVGDPPWPVGAHALFPNRLEENPPRDGFFEHDEYQKVRAHLPASYQDVLDCAYYSGWRRNEILELAWDEVDPGGGVIRLLPRRSKTKAGRVLPISAPLGQVLERRRRARRPGDPRVFRRDGVTVRAWRYALRDACRKAQVPHWLLHDCRRTAARNLIRAGVPERIAIPWPNRLCTASSRGRRSFAASTSWPTL